MYLRPTMIATQETLGVSPTSHAKMFVIMSPVGPSSNTGCGGRELCVRGGVRTHVCVFPNEKRKAGVAVAANQRCFMY